MIAHQRHEQILESVRKNGTVTVPELARSLGTSESTIRRDLAELDSAGLLTKVHGGATSLEDQHVQRDLTIDERAGLHDDAKMRIALEAAKLICPNDLVYIDSGTSTRALIDVLTQTNALYVTDSVANGMALKKRGFRVILLGGELKGATGALVGPEALDTLSHYYFAIGFWGTNGITYEQGFTTPDRYEAQVKRVSMEHTTRPYVLADQSKFGRCAAISFASMEAATILTDQVPESYKDFKNIHTVS
ncbi:MAG: DeoR/GlpR family DNA-binding transcription regulator [Tractidigestivibacter sp.]|jgi:DeoR family fructose operon transcriptional repressor|uniref:DeoR/GlpR family DNA-binding transcription regulator n=1 Tax=Tractidigestivibacter sp. TaxID=2847320 RepID=UPI003D89C9AB